MDNTWLAAVFRVRDHFFVGRDLRGGHFVMSPLFVVCEWCREIFVIYRGYTPFNSDLRWLQAIRYHSEYIGKAIMYLSEY